VSGTELAHRAPDRDRVAALHPDDEVDELELADGRRLARVAPASEDGLVRALAVARAEGWVVLPSGEATKLDAAPIGPADLVVSTRRLTGVVHYEPGDGTLTARAGTPVAELAGRAREGGHHVNPLVPRGSHETLGGVVAAGRSGADRLRRGPLRHDVLGTRVLLADGRVTRSGGALVKNVTGYDLHRLWCGSRGTLCLLLEVSLRLHVLPERSVLLSARSASRAEAFRLADRLAERPVRPLSVVIAEQGDEVLLEVALAGRAEVVEHEEAEVRRLVPAELSAEGEEVGARLAAAEVEPRWPDLVLSSPPSRLEAALRVLEPVPVERIVAHPRVALAWIWLAEPARGSVHELGERAGIALAAAGVRCDVRGAQAAAPPGLAHMLAAKRSFDPDGLFAGGRFHGAL